MGNLPSPTVSNQDTHPPEIAMPPVSQDQNTHPGDIAPPGTPGTGENVCTHCHGEGTMPDGHTCPMCDGSGVVIAGIGGG